MSDLIYDDAPRTSGPMIEPAQSQTAIPKSGRFQEMTGGINTGKRVFAPVNIHVYIASPYTIGDQAMNVRTAIKVADELAGSNIIPYCPLLSHFWHIMFPHTHQFWMDMDLAWVRRCDAVLRLPGESAGADKEVEFANLYNIPVFFSLADLYARIPELTKNAAARMGLR